MSVLNNETASGVFGGEGHVRADLGWPLPSGEEDRFGGEKEQSW